MKKNIFYIIIVCLILSNCTGKKEQKEQEQEIDWTEKTASLSNPKKIIVPTNPFATEIGFRLIDDQYIFSTLSFYQDQILYMYHLQNDTLNYINKITQKGNGPLEMNSTSYVYQQPDKSLFLVSNGYSPKCFWLNDGDSSKITNLGAWEVINFPKESSGIMAHIVLPLNDSRILIKTIGDVSTPFAYYNKGDSVLTYFPYPYPETDTKTSNAQKAIMYAGRIHKHPKKNRIINTCQEGTYACILDIEKDSIKTIKHIYNQLPEYTPAEDGSNIHPKDNKRGFPCIAVTEQYIYLQKSNFVLSDLRKDNPNNGYPIWFDRTIYVFDWEGNPVKKYNLDTYVSSFVVDSNDKFIYAQTMDPSDGSCSIIKYEL